MKYFAFERALINEGVTETTYQRKITKQNINTSTIALLLTGSNRSWKKRRAKTSKGSKVC
jgi:hypothetical protein